MLRYRIISFPILLALLCAVFFWKYGVLLFIFGAAIVVALTLFEAGKLCNHFHLDNDPLFTAEIGGIAAFLTYLSFGFSGHTDLFSLMLVGILLGSVLTVWGTLLFCKDEMKFRRIFTSIALVMILGFPYILFGCFYFNSLPYLLLYLMLTAKAMDTGGYIFGMLTSMLPGGNHKIAPSISPKKSWEGFFGGMACSVLVSFIFYYFKPLFPWFVYLAGGLLLALLSFAGDLTESALKRRANVKDSAAWIPGMGGVFDVVDSFLYIGPAVGLIALINLLLSF